MNNNKKKLNRFPDLRRAMPPTSAMENVSHSQTDMVAKSSVLSLAEPSAFESSAIVNNAPSLTPAEADNNDTSDALPSVSQQMRTALSANMITANNASSSSPADVNNVTSVAVSSASKQMPTALSTALATVTKTSSPSTAVVNATHNALPSASKQLPTASSDILNASTQPQLGADWITVPRKKVPKRRNVVVGRNENNDLGVFSRFKWLHLSSFKPTVSEVDIINYVSNQVIVDKQQIACYKLVKKDTNETALKYINFKLGVPEHVYFNLLKPEIWPTNVNIRQFRFFQKQGGQLPPA
ncbi:PREDICTED: uncharacterized protein LOC108382447 [Rhagoletis zephyria]|uniref:uncharacterized protein LOC108382447 n=1 Tax=Rhagoletis zephyria TaxID=28612 RepID=UPI00081122E4|nr:PREDICTED: uncharacterized protein LOC108382447 [Rhagoletis zephyria]